MILINFIKVAAICFADIINRLVEPFKEARFTDTADLADLESRFSKHLEANFKNGGWFLYEKPLPADAGDVALYQGLYIAYLVLKRADITQAFAAFKTLFVNNILIRGYASQGGLNDSTSNDSATGALFALYTVWEHRGREADELIVRWTQRVVDSEYALTNLLALPTKYGRLEDGWKTDPLRITLLLALLALASKIDKATFDPHYEALYNKYQEILPYAKVKFLWWDTAYDTQRAAIHLHILWQLTRDTIYKDGLRRLHRITRKENNAFVQVLCSPVLAPEELNLTILNTFHYDARIQGTLQAHNSGTVDDVSWGGRKLAKQTLHIWRRGSQEFFWSRRMFSLDEWMGHMTPHVHHSGLDFLIVYWLAKRMGLTSRLSGVIL